VSLFLALGLFQRDELTFGKNQTLLRDLGLERLEPFLHRLEIMALPNRADAGGRNRKAQFAQFIGDTDLAEGGPIERELDQLGFERRIDAVLQDRLAARQLLQCQLAASLVEILEPIKAVAAIAHHLTGLADIAELSRQLQKPDLRADDFLFLRHGVWCPS